MSKKTHTSFPRTEEEWARWHKRQLIWKHNSFFGHVAMSTRQMITIQQASTTTPHSKQLAAQIQLLLSDLSLALKERNDG